MPAMPLDPAVDRFRLIHRTDLPCPACRHGGPHYLVGNHGWIVAAQCSNPDCGNCWHINTRERP